MNYRRKYYFFTNLFKSRFQFKLSLGRLHAVNVDDNYYAGNNGNNGLIEGVLCNCPNECDETIYFQELTQVRQFLLSPSL
jgi:hypothetical protein